MTTFESDRPAAQRPVERYELGMHHLAQPTIDPAATIDFYVRVMGAKISHCVASRGWRPGHFDYIHMFLDLGKGDNIAMFYYFGAETPEDWPRYGTHHSFGANSIEELGQWADWLEVNGFEVQQRHTYEVMSSIYTWDPNGRFLEIAANHRPLNEVDAEDGELTAEALILAAAEKASSVTRMWQLKAEIIEQRSATSLRAPSLMYPKLGEFEWLASAAGDSLARTYDIGSFTVLEGVDELRVARPSELPESLWWGSGTGGIKGSVTTFDDDVLVIAS